MSNFTLVLPAGKKAPAHVPETDGGKVSLSRVASRKKPRSFSEPRPGRKKSFRHHLDQALGKGFPVAMVSPSPKEHVPQTAGKPPQTAGKPLQTVGKRLPTAGKPPIAGSLGKGLSVVAAAPPVKDTVAVAPTGKAVSQPASAPVPDPIPEQPSFEPMPGMHVATPEPSPGRSQKPVDRALFAPEIAKNKVPVPSLRKVPFTASPETASAVPAESRSLPEMNAKTTDAYGFDKRLNGALKDEPGNPPPAGVPISDVQGTGGTQSQASDSAMASPATPIAKGGSPDDPSPGFTKEEGSFTKEEGKGKGKDVDMSRLSSQSLSMSSGAAPAVPVPERPAEPARIPEFAEKIAETAKSGGGTVTLRVHPPELGPVVVTVQVDPRSKAVDVRLSVRDQSVRSAIEGKGETLKRLLREEGFSMHSLDVSLGEAGTLSAGAVLSTGPSSQSGAGTSGTFNSQASPQDFSGGTTLSSGGDGQGSGGTRENGSSAATDRRPEHLPEGSGDEMTLNGTGAPAEHRGFHRIA